MEIIPKEAYTRHDLDWQDKNSRSSLEMAEETSRPAIANIKENLEDYDTILIGFSVW